MKVLFVLGARPEAIKVAPIIKVASQRPESFECRICVTAQHLQEGMAEDHVHVTGNL